MPSLGIIPVSKRVAPASCNNVQNFKTSYIISLMLLPSTLSLRLYISPKTILSLKLIINNALFENYMYYVNSLVWLFTHMVLLVFWVFIVRCKHIQTRPVGISEHDNGPLAWASYQIHKISVCTCMDYWEHFPATDFNWKLLVSDSGMHHGTCVTHVPWCLSRSLTHVGGEYVHGISMHSQPTILHIWQEAHGRLQL